MLRGILGTRLARQAARLLLRVLLATFLLAGFSATAFAQFTITLQPNTLPAGTVGSAYSQVITAVGGNAPYTFTLLSGSLPAGLTLDSDGTLHGTPSSGGASTFQVQATDSGGNDGFRTYNFSTGTAGGMSISPASLPDGSQGVAYSQSVSGSGGTGPYTFTLASGTLPAGLSLASNGTISGTPTGSGPYNFTIDGADSAGNTGSRSYTVNIGANILSLSPTTLPNATNGTPYNQSVSASGGTGPYTYSISSGSLPAGLSMNAAGVISGTPTGSGSSTFTIRAIDSVNNTGTGTYNVNVGSNILTVSPATLPNGTRTVAYNQTVTASGGTGPYTFAVSAGSLPNGLSLSPAGVLSGTPTAAGTFNFTVQATDSLFNTGSQAYSVIINPAPLTISPSSLPAGTAGTAYSQTLSASGGTAPYSYTVLSGTLPTGLTLSGANITGTPTAAGSYSFTIQATDTTPNTGTQNYTINIGTSGTLTVSPTSLANGTRNLAYSQTVSASGGTGPYTFSVSAGSLPAGLTLNASSGAITGTPTGSGASSFTIRALDSVGNTGTRPYTVNIGTTTLTVTPASLPAGTRTLSYRQTLGATGGTGPYTYSVTTGSLPAGLSLSSAGVISGTPTTAGTSSFSVRARDSLGNIGNRNYSLHIGTVTLTVSPSSLAAAVTGRAYSQTVTASGGTAPYTFSLSSGTLPAGLTLNASSGVISGTPGSFTTATFTVRAVDVNGNAGTRTYTLTGRADPTADPNVRGTVSAQVDTAERFARAQLGNVNQRLTSLHYGFKPCSFSFGITPPMQASQSNQLQFLGYDSYGRPVYQQQQPQPQPARPNGAECWSEEFSSMAGWTAGSFQFGSQNTRTSATNNKFLTGGLTGGLDWRMSQSLIIGAAIGYGADRSDIAGDGTRVDGTSFSGSLYASLRPFNPLFLDFVAGYGSMSFDNRRFVTADGTMANGKRDGSYWFGSATASLELGRNGYKFAPYVTADYISATFKGYSENGASAQVLTYQDAKASSHSMGVGLRGSVDVPVSFGVLTPHAKVEYRKITQSDVDQGVYFTDLGAGTSASLLLPSNSYNVLTTTLGLRLAAFGGMAVDVEYGFAFGSEAYKAQTIRMALSVPF